MVDIEQQDDGLVKQEQCQVKDSSLSSLMEQINEQLIRMRQDDLELTEQLTSLYDGLCHLRQALTNPPTSSNRDLTIVPIQMDPSIPTHYHGKPRSDSEPNILTDRLRLIPILDNLH